jgi:dTDP-4-dehydrorhamnose 3,5-epimerase
MGFWFRSLEIPIINVTVTQKVFMIFKELQLKGAYLIDPEKKEDDRGFFARIFCCEAFQDKGLVGRVMQSNISYSKKTGTLRGMHYQIAPYAEAKLIRCIYGAIYDVMIDLRPDSPTFKQWVGVKINASSRQMVYVPEGMAHGFQTLADHTEVLYHVSTPFTPDAERGLRWDDPTFGIKWPLPVSVISGKDKSHPLYLEK